MKNVVLISSALYRAPKFHLHTSMKNVQPQSFQCSMTFKEMLMMWIQCWSQKQVTKGFILMGPEASLDHILWPGRWVRARCFGLRRVRSKRKWRRWRPLLKIETLWRARLRFDTARILMWKSRQYLQSYFQPLSTSVTKRSLFWLLPDTFLDVWDTSYMKLWRKDVPLFIPEPISLEWTDGAERCFFGLGAWSETAKCSRCCGWFVGWLSVGCRVVG